MKTMKIKIENLPLFIGEYGFENEIRIDVMEPGRSGQMHTVPDGINIRKNAPFGGLDIIVEEITSITRKQVTTVVHYAVEPVDDLCDKLIRV